MRMKKLIFLGVLTIILVFAFALFNNERKDKLIKKETMQIHIGMAKKDVLEVYGNANAIVSSKEFSYLPENIEKYYYNREIDLYPLIKKELIIQIIISIDKNTDKVSEIVVDRD